MPRICHKDHAGSVPKKLGRLPERQAGDLRHRCAACAYERGRLDERQSLMALMASNRGISLDRLNEAADTLEKGVPTAPRPAPQPHAH